MAVVRHLKAVLDAKDNASPVFKRFSGALKLLGGVAATVGAYKLGKDLVEGMKSAAEAAGIQEAAEAKLAQAIRNTGGSVSDLLPQYKVMAARLQDLTGVGDEVILSYQAQLVALGKLSGKGLERATKAALDLAAAQGMDLKSAFDLVAKAAAGYTATLSRYGIILDESVPKEQKFQAALKMIEERFGGQAQAKLNTFAGRLQELSGRLGDLKEKIGKAFASPRIQAAIHVLATEIKRFTDSLDEERILRFSAALVELGITIAKYLVKSVQGLRNAIASLNYSFNTLAGYATGGQGTFLGQAFLEQAKADYDRLNSIVSQTDELVKYLEKLRRRIEEYRAPGGAGAGIQAEALPVGREFDVSGLEIPESVQESLSQVRSSMEEIQVATSAWGVTLSEIIDKWVQDGTAATDLWLQNLAKAGTHIETFSEHIGKVFRGWAVSAVGQFADQLVSAALEGKRAFGDFFRHLLKWLAAAILKALILRTILSFFGPIGQGVGMAMTYTGATASLIGSETMAGRRGMIAGAAGGWLVPGSDTGRDTVPAMLRPGEAVLPRELTDYLMTAAMGGGAAAPVEVHLHGSLPALVDEISTGVRDGSLVLTASETATTRTVR